MTLIVPQEINTPGYTVKNGQLHYEGKPVLVDGKPVHVKFTNTK